MARIRTSKTKPENKPYRFDLLIAVISLLFQLGYAMSGLPANIVLACICWATTLIAVLHYFWVWSLGTQMPTLTKWLVILAFPSATVAIAWHPVLREYKREHPPEPKVEDLTAMVNSVDPTSGEVQINFENSGLRDATVLALALTLSPRFPVQFTPLPTNVWAIFSNAPPAVNNDAFAFILPEHVGFSMGPTNRWTFSMELLHARQFKIVKGDSVYTNFTPTSDTLRKASEIFADGTIFELGIRAESIDYSNRHQISEFNCGTYTISHSDRPATLAWESNCPCVFQVTPSERSKQEFIVRTGTRIVGGGRWGLISDTNLDLNPKRYLYWPPIDTPLTLYFPGSSKVPATK
jgi:hypothetical protein